MLFRSQMKPLLQFFPHIPSQSNPPSSAKNNESHTQWTSEPCPMKILFEFWDFLIEPLPSLSLASLPTLIQHGFSSNMNKLKVKCLRMSKIETNFILFSGAKRLLGFQRRLFIKCIVNILRIKWKHWHFGWFWMWFFRNLFAFLNMMVNVYVMFIKNKLLLFSEPRWNCF